MYILYGVAQKEKIMTQITPVGKSNFRWSPKEDDALVKTASSDSEQVEQPDTDKDALYAAAKTVVEAQFALEEEIIEAPMDGMDGAIDGAVDAVVDGVGGVEGISDSEIIEDAEDAEPSEGSGDVQEAVAELVEKANKAEEVAEAVTDALETVEEAVQGVKDAVGVEVEEEISEEVSDIEDKEDTYCEDIPCEDKDDSDDDEDKDDDEIVQESEEDCYASAKTAATEGDGFVSLAKISPTTRKKVYTYWTKYLKYPADYSKLLVTDHE